MFIPNSFFASDGGKNMLLKVPGKKKKKQPKIKEEEIKPTFFKGGSPTFKPRLEETKPMVKFNV